MTGYLAPGDPEGKRARDRKYSRAAPAARLVGNPAAVTGAPVKRMKLPVAAPVDTDWQDKAACKGEDPLIFDGETLADVQAAQLICRSCPVRAMCLLASRSLSPEYGVWGGVDLAEAAGKRRAVAS
jgi:WhiB family transcriptional regulator, redox-sensing transcriptional regulator